MAGPIDQFVINRIVPIEIGGVDLSFTNSAAYMALTVAIGAGFLWLAARPAALVPSRVQSCGELLYEFVDKTLGDNTGREGERFLPLVFSLFLFILVANLIGMFPYAFTVTSHIIVTFALAMIVFGTVTIYGFARHGTKFLRLFMPSGVPVALAPIIVPIEVLSYFSRPLSHSIRLFAVMLAGHVTLKVFAGFVVSMAAAGTIGTIGAILPLVMTVAIVALEFLMSVIQAYVFTMLTCMYLNDAIHPGH